MDKKEFTRQLNQLLADLPEEERREAVSYYEEYLEDAGSEQEAQTLEELGSPEQVAATIRENLYGDLAQNGIYTETGYHADTKAKEKLELDRFTQIVPHQGMGGSKDKETRETEETGETEKRTEANRGMGTEKSKESRTFYQDRADTMKDTANAEENQTDQKRHSWQKQKKSMSGETKALLIVLALLFSIPLAAVALALIAVIVGVMAAIFGVVVSVVALTGAFLITGVALLVIGIANIFSASPAGILLCGIGFLFFGAGMLFCIATVFLFKTILPLLAKGFVSLCKLPFQKGERMA